MFCKGFVGFFQGGSVSLVSSLNSLDRFGFSLCFAGVALEFFFDRLVSLVFCKVSFSSLRVDLVFCCPPGG